MTPPKKTSIALPPKVKMPEKTSIASSPEGDIAFDQEALPVPGAIPLVPSL